MDIVSFVTQKGGSGKTTLACHWAWAEHQAGRRTAIVDLDPQQSAMQWATDRADGPLPCRARAHELAGALERLYQRGIDQVAIDTTPTFDRVTEAAIAASDLVVVPVRPTGLDLAVVARPLTLAAQHQTPAVCVLNQVPPGHVMLHAALEALEGIHVCPTVVRSRVAWQRAMIGGAAVREVERSPRLATMEWRDVHRYCRELLDRRPDASSTLALTDP